MRRLHTRAPVAALVALCCCTAGAARAECCTYLHHIYLEIQQQQRMYVQLQMMQTQQHMTQQHTQTTMGQQSRIVSNHVTHGVTGNTSHVTTRNRTTTTTHHTTLHEWYSLHSVTHTGPGHGAHHTVSLERHRSVTVHEERSHAEHTHTLTHVTPGHEATTHHTTVVPGTPPAKQHQTVQKDTNTSSAHIQVRIESLTKLTVWSYAVCGRCHQHDPSKTPLLTNRPQGPAPNMVPAKPQANRLAEKPRPQPNVVAERPRPNGRVAVGRPSLPGLARRPETMPSRTPAAVPMTPPARTWQPNLPSWALVPPPSLPAPGLSRGTLMGDTPWPTTSSLTDAGQVPPPSLALVRAEAPAPEPPGAIPPPDYPPLRHPSWDSPDPDADAPLALARVSEAAAVERVPPPPLPGAAPSWATK